MIYKLKVIIYDNQNLKCYASGSNGIGFDKNTSKAIINFLNTHNDIYNSIQDYIYNYKEKPNNTNIIVAI